MDRDWRGKYLKWISNMIEIKDIDLVDNQTLREKNGFGYDVIRKAGCAGYAALYLSIYSSFGHPVFGHSIDDLCEGFEILDKSFSVSEYKKLVRIDRKLGISEEEQLDRLLFHTTQSDLIEVCKIFRNLKRNCYLGYRFEKSGLERC